MSRIATGSWNRVVSGIVIGSAVSCAGAQDMRFDTLCGDQHERKASEEHRRADKHFARVRKHHAREATIAPGEQGWSYLGSSQPYYEPDQPEHYTLDPRVRSPSDRDVDQARRHRDLALRHEAAAARLHGECPRPTG